MKKFVAIVVSVIFMFSMAAGAEVHTVGDRCLCIAEIQAMLAEAGYDVGMPDGILGKGTQAAIADLMGTDSVSIEMVAMAMPTKVYIANRDSGIVHFASSGCVKKMKDANKVACFEANVEKYKKCKKCFSR